MKRNKAIPMSTPALKFVMIKMPISKWAIDMPEWPISSKNRLPNVLTVQTDIILAKKLTRPTT